MLDCYILSLLSLLLTLSIIIIIIIIISTINVILEEKVKATEWEGGFTNKTVWTCLYAYYLYNNFFCLFISLFVFRSFSCEKNLFFEFKIAFVNLRKIKIKIYQKKQKKKNKFPNMSGKFKKM